MLGDYSRDLPTSLLTQKRTAPSSATPELSRIGAARICWIKEIAENDGSFNIGLVKQLTGNDKFYARSLFSEGFERTPMFKLVMICNSIPKLVNADKATWNRIRIIPFESTFTDDAPKTLEEQIFKSEFPIDRRFNEKLPTLVKVLPYYLLEHLKSMNFSNDIFEPTKVTYHTTECKKNNDIFTKFVEDRITRCNEDEGRRVGTQHIHNQFKQYVGQNYPGIRTLKEIDKVSLVKEISKRIGKPQSNNFLNIKLIDNEGTTYHKR
eukprot:Pgem_evm2s3004